MRAFVRQLTPAIVAMVVLTVLTGVVYPLLVTGAAQAAFGRQAGGSIVHAGGRAVGSSLVGQTFTSPGYFHGRPSAAGNGYDATNSGGSNLGPSNPKLLDAVTALVAAYRTENHLPDSQLVPVDAVTASASGLDPDISIANARLQAPRVAAARTKTVEEILALVAAATHQRPLGILGDPGVNVLELNLALDRAA